MGNHHSAGGLHIETERQVYLPGEVVQGTVYVHLHETVHSEGLYMKIKGEEKTWWREHRTETRTRYVDGREETYMEQIDVDHDGKHSFYKFKVPLHRSSGHLAAGQYAFPFMFRLEDGLSSTFEVEEHHMRAAVKYKIKAELDVHHGHDIKASKHIVINQLPLSAITPAVKEHTEHVKVCCCFDKGPVWMRVTCDKNAYIPGEHAYLVAEIDNQSSVEVKHLRSKLVRHLHLRSHHGGHSHHSTEVVAEAGFEGVSAGTSLIADSARRVPLHLSHHGRDLPPGCNGNLVECFYKLEVECDVSCAPDIKVDIPVIIYHGIPSEVFVPVAPPGWAPTMMPAADVGAMERVSY